MDKQKEMEDLIDRADLEKTRLKERRGLEVSWTCGYCSTTSIEKGKTCSFCGAAELKDSGPGLDVVDTEMHKPSLLHNCPDWDYLLISRTSPEFEACTCFTEKEKDV